MIRLSYREGDGPKGKPGRVVVVAQGVRTPVSERPVPLPRKRGRPRKDGK